MIIRRMTFEDYGQAEELFKKLHNLHAEMEPDMYKKLDCVNKKRDFKKQVKSKNKIMLCAEEDGKIIGVSNTKFCTSGMTEIKMAFMDALYVDENFRSSGVGKKLFLETERIAKENGAKRLDLTVWNFNKGAIKFYESLGMVIQRYTFEKTLK